MKHVLISILLVSFTVIGQPVRSFANTRIVSLLPVWNTTLHLTKQDRSKQKPRQKEDGKQKVKQVPKAKRQSKPAPVKQDSKGKGQSSGRRR